MRRPVEPRLSGKRSDDRGVSEVIGFILVFAIIITSVTLLSMTGFQAMRDYQDGEQLRNAERAIEAFAENANDVMRYDSIDTRQGELSLQEGTVTTSSTGTNLTINIDGKKRPVGELGTFTYTVDNDRIVYEGGGVIRGDDSGSVFLSQPQLQCNDETAVISLVRIDDGRSIQSSGQVGFTISEKKWNSTLYSGKDNVAIEVNSDSPTSDAWNSTLESWDGEPTDNNKKCELGSGSGQVVVTIVDVEIQH